MNNFLSKIISSPVREFILIALVAAAFGFNFLFGEYQAVIFFAALIGSLPTLKKTFYSLLRERRITIELFNSFALTVSFVSGEFSSAAFIVLMLLFAEILEWRTSSNSRHAVEELLKLKPLKALKEKNGETEEILVDDIKKGDTIIVKTGARIPADGIVIFGAASVNESSVTGESMPVKKIIGDKVIGSTLNESGVLKILVQKVGKDSTLERMVELIKEAARNKSRVEKIADKFASLFLPFVGAAGVFAYFLTGNIETMVAIFLVACADDMAVAIPLAMTAAQGRAAKRGVIVKGGEWFDVLSKIKTLVLDKTGTLTYGSFSVSESKIEPWISENDFLFAVAVAEKFSEHHIGRAIFKTAASRFEAIPEPDEIKVYGGSGIIARYKNNEIVIGDESILMKSGIDGGLIKEKLKELSLNAAAKTFVFVNKRFAGVIMLADIPRREAAESLKKLADIGVKRVIMFTGDNESAAEKTANALGIKEFHAGMSPEDKLRELELLEKESGPVCVIGDGINDAPALARADIGIAMGGAGMAVAVEAADAIILIDNLSRVPEMILLGRKTMSVIKGDAIIWFLSNVIGFAFVFLGLFGPALAAFYNFATDFLPLINSSRLFKKNL